MNGILFHVKFSIQICNSFQLWNKTCDRDVKCESIYKTALNTKETQIKIQNIWKRREKNRKKWVNQMDRQMCHNNVRHRRHHPKNQWIVIYQRHRHVCQNHQAFGHHQLPLRSHLPQRRPFHQHHHQLESEESVRHMVMVPKLDHRHLNYTKVNAVTFLIFLCIFLSELELNTELALRVIIKSWN